MPGRRPPTNNTPHPPTNATTTNKHPQRPPCAPQAYNLQGYVAAAYGKLLKQVDRVSVRASLAGGAALGYAVRVSPSPSRRLRALGREALLDFPAEHLSKRIINAKHPSRYHRPHSSALNLNQTRMHRCSR